MSLVFCGAAVPAAVGQAGRLHHNFSWTAAKKEKKQPFSSFDGRKPIDTRSEIDKIKGSAVEKAVF
jgi:hypothetical protein